jgi:hypothetical protein
MRIEIPDSVIIIREEEAFRLLVKSLNMDFVLNENIDFFIKKNDCGDNCVYYIHNDEEREYDYRGDLFVALRNVAVQIFPNLEFRSAPYIYNR